MIRYMTRRLIQMIPTMIGVVLVTFVLFNLVGGSPARMILGDKASARDLEAFDETRGFNRPLFWGTFSDTRLYAETDFSKSQGPWSGLSGVVASVKFPADGLRLKGPAAVDFPLAFDLFPGHVYEWTLTYQSNKNQSDVLLRNSADTPVSLSGNGAVSWRDQVEQGSVYRPEILIPDGAELLITSLTCRRVNAQPWNSQWSHYVGQLLRLDFGWSHSANQHVIEILKQGIVPTLCLATPILAGEIAISLILALGCAYYRNRLFDRIVLVLSVFLMSVNYLVWIVAGQYWLGFKLDLFPVWGFESWSYLILPVMVGVIHGVGPNVRFYRTVMLEEMHKDYVRTARAKGVGTGGILFRHVLKNAMIPVITNVVLSLPFLYTGSLLLETFFGIPGLGYLSVNAINSSDVDVVRAVVVTGSFLYLIANLAADLCYAWVDPRVKLS